MMRQFSLFAFLTLAAASVWAFPGPDPVYFPAELQAVQADLGDRDLGALKVGELIPVAGRLDVARQKDQYLWMAGALSLAWPGAGQFAAGDWAGGTLHTGLHLGIGVGAMAWAYSLLPSDLQVDRLDYFEADDKTIEAAWKAHNVRDLLPAVGAMAAGGVLDLALRLWSARDAQTTAKAAIDAGKVTFEPRFDGGHLGMGMRF